MRTEWAAELLLAACAAALLHTKGGRGPTQSSDLRKGCSKIHGYNKVKSGQESVFFIFLNFRVLDFVILVIT